jgi:hypothetical protein
MYLEILWFHSVLLAIGAKIGFATKRHKLLTQIPNRKQLPGLLGVKQVRLLDLRLRNLVRRFTSADP